MCPPGLEMPSPAKSSSGSNDPPAALVGDNVEPVSAWMYADRIHWVCDLARQELAIFARDRDAVDSDDPAMVCTVDEWLACVVPADRRRILGKLRSLFATATQSFEAQFRIAVPDGRQQWTDVWAIVLRDEQGTPLRIVGLQSKLGEMGECKRSPAPSAFHDPLTGLPNRRLFDRCLADAMEDAKQDRAYRFAVLFVDLDRFKQVNDRHGHLAGDRVLLAVAQRFSHCVRPEDIVARRDGDEFTILLKDLRRPDDAIGAADRILQHLRSPLALDGAESIVTASIGITWNHADLSSPDELLRSADEAMYRAKAQGGDRHMTSAQPGQISSDLRPARVGHSHGAGQASPAGPSLRRPRRRARKLPAKS